MIFWKDIFINTISYGAILGTIKILFMKIFAFGIFSTTTTFNPAFTWVGMGRGSLEKKNDGDEKLFATLYFLKLSFQQRLRWLLLCVVDFQRLDFPRAVRLNQATLTGLTLDNPQNWCYICKLQNLKDLKNVNIYIESILMPFLTKMFSLCVKFVRNI